MLIPPIACMRIDQALEAPLCPSAVETNDDVEDLHAIG
jgi:hypothetical protein